MISLILAVMAVPVQLHMYDATVEKCYDGDTCTLTIDLGFDVVLRHQTVRLCDIDAPEMRPLETRKAAEKARDRLVHILENSRSVRLAIPGKLKRDSFGRILGYIFGDGINMSYALLREGLVTMHKKKCGS